MKSASKTDDVELQVRLATNFTLPNKKKKKKCQPTCKRHLHEVQNVAATPNLLHLHGYTLWSNPCLSPNQQDCDGHIFTRKRIQEKEILKSILVLFNFLVRHVTKTCAECRWRSVLKYSV
jgi:D-alanyl-D-alanine dipeptidase